MKEEFENNLSDDSFFTEGEKATQKIIFGVGAINRAGEAAKELGLSLIHI